MSVRNTTSTWGAIARLLHWVIAALLVVQFTLAWSADELPEDSPQQLTLIAWHVSFGLTLLALAVARIAWRLANPTPQPPAGAARWERIVAHVTQGLLYLLLLAIPLSGWVMASGHGDALAWFGVTVPPLVAKGAAVGRPAHEAHEVLAYLLLVLVGLHVLAALKHHFVAGNDVLRRMRPW